MSKYYTAKWDDINKRWRPNKITEVDEQDTKRLDWLQENIGKFWVTLDSKLREEIDAAMRKENRVERGSA